MSWRDTLRKVTLPDGRRAIGASFRGVPFFVASADRTGGRRTVTHEFPLRDDPFVEDLGRRARTFSFDGYLLGDDYVRQRDALLSALEDSAGPGELIHPYHGVRRVVCTQVSVREAIADGGMVTFSIEFAEAPTQAVAPVAESHPTETVSASAAAAAAASSQSFEAAYEPDDLPSFALESAESALTTIAEATQLALAPLVHSEQELALLAARVRLLTLEASSIVRDPAEAVSRFTAAFSGLEEAIADAPGAIVQALISAYGTETEPLAPATTSTREREHANHAALVAAIRRSLVFEAARLATLVEWESHDQAIEARNEIADLLDEQAAEADDTAYPAIVQLRADLVAAVPGDAELARILTIEQRVPVPSLVLAHRLYGSVDLEEDIVSRNRIRHPGVCAGTLTVLSGV